MFECVWPFCGVGTKGLITYVSVTPNIKKLLKYQKNYRRNIQKMTPRKQVLLCRSNHQRFSVKKCSKNFCNLYIKTPALESPLNKVAGLKASTLLKKTSAKVFSVVPAKCFRTLILNTSSGCSWLCNKSSWVEKNNIVFFYRYIQSLIAN